MTDHWMHASFDVSNQILGCDVDFHDGPSTRLEKDQVDNKLFLEPKTGRSFSIRDLIGATLKMTNTRKQDLIKPAAATEAMEKGICVGKPDLDMRCAPGSISLSVEGEWRDVERIVFDVELTVRPKKQS